MSSRQPDGVDDPVVENFVRVLRADVDQAAAHAQRSGRLSSIVAAAASQHRQPRGLFPSLRWRWASLGFVLAGGAVFAGIWALDRPPAVQVASRATTVAPVAPTVIPLPSAIDLQPQAPMVRSPKPASRPRLVANAEPPYVLFARANQARRAGKYRAAERDYGQLQILYPTAAEAHVSRIALGRLLLDRNQDLARAQGLFEDYLKAQPSGALIEQALAGRALALQKRRQSSEELLAWQKLLAAFPDSAHAAEARLRVKELSKK